jgi:RNA polymerase primary sigma factor
MSELLAKWRRATAQLQGELDRDPTHEEVADQLNLPLRKLNIIKKAIRIYQATPQADAEREEMPLEEALMDEQSEQADTGLIAREDAHLVQRLLAQLNAREASVLRMRYGLDDEEPMALTDIGKRLGLTRQRVQQLASRALGKLRRRLLAS